jgi:hypothetical protein
MSIGAMSEGRIYPDDYRRVQSRSAVPVSASIAILVTIYIAMALWSSGYSEILQWSPYVLLTILLVLVFVTVYWRVRALRSRARAVPPEKTYFEGWAVDGLVLTIVVLALFLGLTTLRGSVTRLLEGGEASLAGLPSGILWIAIAVYSLLVASRSRLRVEKEGLILRGSLLPSVPNRFIPFKALQYIRMEGRILSFRGLKGYPRGWQIVRDAEKLKSVIRKLVTPE